jgi:hypothetical protein
LVFSLPFITHPTCHTWLRGSTSSLRRASGGVHPPQGRWQALRFYFRHGGIRQAAPQNDALQRTLPFQEMLGDPCFCGFTGFLLGFWRVVRIGTSGVRGGTGSWRGWAARFCLSGYFQLCTSTIKIAPGAILYQRRGLQNRCPPQPCDPGEVAGVVDRCIDRIGAGRTTCVHSHQDRSAG